MNENPNQSDQDDLIDPGDFNFQASFPERMPASGSGQDTSLYLQSSQQSETNEQLQYARNLSMGAPHIISLQNDEQALASQGVQHPPNFTLGQADPNFPLHAVTDRELQYPGNPSLGQPNSVLQSARLLSALQAAANGLVQNPPNLGVGRASSSFRHSSSQNVQQAVTKGVLQYPSNLSLAQAGSSLQHSTLRTRQQALPDGPVQNPQNVNLVQASSILQPSSFPNVPQAMTNSLVQNPPNLSMGHVAVNHVQASNLENHNSPNVVAQSHHSDGRAIQNPEAEMSLDESMRYLYRILDLSIPLDEFPPLDDMYGDLGVAGIYMEQNYRDPDDIPGGTQNEIDNVVNPISHQGRPNQQEFTSGQIQQNPLPRTGRDIPLPSSGMNTQTSAIPQPGTPAHQHTLGDAAQQPNQIDAPPMPQSPQMRLDTHNQASVSHAPSTETPQQILGNGTPQHNEAIVLHTPQLPNSSNVQANFVQSPLEHVDQHVLNSAGLQENHFSAFAGSDAQGNNIIATESRQGLMGMVEHPQQHSEALQWISSLLSLVSQNLAGVNEVTNEDAEPLPVPNFRNHLQRPSLERTPQGGLPEQRLMGSATGREPQFRKLLGSSYHKVFGKPTDPAMKFSAQLNTMRSKKASPEEISEGITISELPVLDEEMALDSKYTGFDFVPWHAERSNSPTITEITRAVRSSEQGTVVPVETLFNHLYRLSRSSFLQREEKVHLELATLFLKNSRSEGEENCEKDAKELIKWLERTFSNGQLASLVEKLVSAVDEVLPVRLLVDRAKSKYKPRNTEMTLLGSFYDIMNKQHDITQANQDIAKKKKKVENNIKEARKAIKKIGMKPPKTTYERRTTGNNITPVEMEHALIRSFNATRWLLVDCTDSHYAYAQSVVDAAEILRSEAQGARDKKLESLNAELSYLEERVTEAPSQDIEAAQALICKKIDEETGRDMNVLEKTVLACFVETIVALGKVTVSGFLQAIGGVPHRLALTLEGAGEELEKLRGNGSGKMPGVEDMVRVSQIVEGETENHEKLQRALEKKESYLLECQQLLDSPANADGAA